ncbi:MAG TPA: flagellar biosynthesis protein FlhF [Gammaproteobacteria bacterium]|nr:flagellar biosynthesis protein FlhF [Gammaproteobacteria bacterium]
MNIRRFVATDMREALAAIRTDLGADAVMLSSRKLGKGVEVIAAIDYDDSLLGAVGVAPPAARMQDRTGRDFGYAADDEADARADADPRGRAAGSTDEPTDNPTERPAEARGREQLIAARVAAAREAALEEAAARAAAAAAHARPARPTAVRPVTQEPAVRAAPAGAAASPDQPGVAQEIKDLRRLLETQLASLAWNDLNRQAPIRARTLRELTKLGVDSTLAVELADEIPAEAGSQEALRLIVRRFGERLPLAQGDLTDRGGIFAVVGPTGVGKTTSIAKIAARFVLRHSVDELGLVSTDTYRIGARQQLSNFARILRAPLEVAESADDLRRVLDGFSKKKLVLIDTAGMSQRDVRLANQFTTLKLDDHRIQTLLTLSAGADRACLAEALRVFAAVSPEALIVTKLDEAAALGGILSLAIRHELPIAYLSDGQRVPEDLHLASPKRFWLMHSAIKLTQDPGSAPDENELAEHFGQVELAANA